MEERTPEPPPAEDEPAEEKSDSPKPSQDKDEPEKESEDSFPASDPPSW
jgi:hypothetical protein